MHLCLFVPLQETNTIFHPIAIFLNQLIKQDSIVRVNKDTWNIWKCWVYISIYLFSFDKKEPIQFLIL